MNGAVDDSAEPGPPEAPPEAATRTMSVRSFLGETVIYGLGTVGDKLIGLLLIPIATSILGPEGYGILSLFITTSYIALILCSMGIPHAFARFYIESTSPQTRAQILDTAFWLSTFGSIVGGTLVLAGGRPLSQWLFDTPQFGPLLLVGATTYLSVLEMLGSFRIQADGRPKVFVWIRLASALGKRSLSLGLILAGYGAWGWLIGELLGLLITVVLMIPSAFRDVRFDVRRFWIWEMTPYGFFLVPGLLFHALMIGSDKYMLRAMTENPFYQVGCYSVGERISSCMQLVVLAFLTGWRRFAFTNISSVEGRKMLSGGVSMYLLLAGYGALGLILLGDDLMRMVIDPAFAEGITVIPALTLGCLLTGAADMFAVGLHQSKQTLKLSWLTALGAIVNVGLNYLWVPKYGIAGAAYATLICQIFRTWIMWRYSQGEYPIPLDYRRLSWITLWLVGTYVVGRSIDLAATGLGAAAVQAALLAAFPILAWFGGLLSAGERQSVLAYARRLTRRG
jgi:O-antigen/teichoic acid export membrane protein